MGTRTRTSIATGFVVAATIAAAAPAAQPGPVSIVFRGSYVLVAQASQPAFRASTADCVPGSTQEEYERFRWTIRFTAPRLPKTGTVSLPAQSATVSGVHVWTEASAKCAAYPAGKLVCRTHFAPGRPRLTLEIARGVVTFHPELQPVAISDGCSGEVYNEHPDCGVRDSTAVTDFAFAGALRSRAPRLAPPALTASFDVSRSRRCAKPGVRNLHKIRQSAYARYRGSFELVAAGN